MRSSRIVFRITSYNVCYTKLLRAFDLDYSHQFSKGELTANTNFTNYYYKQDQHIVSNYYEDNGSFIETTAFNTLNEQHTKIFAIRTDYARITSYNVCYTKLLRQLYSWDQTAQSTMRLTSPGLSQSGVEPTGAYQLSILGSTRRYTRSAKAFRLM